MELSPEEKKRIYEEEKARLEEQEKIKQEGQKDFWVISREAAEKKIKAEKDEGGWGKTRLKPPLKLPCGVVLFVLLVIVLFIGYRGCVRCNKELNESGQEYDRTHPDLIVAVSFTGTQFVITNANNFDWTNVRLIVNGKFVFETQRIKAGETYTIGAMQFANSDGTRFNPFSMKPQNLEIRCEEKPLGQWTVYGLE